MIKAFNRKNARGKCNAAVKRAMVPIILIALCIYTLLTSVSCGGGIDRKEAKQLVSDFLDALSSHEYEKAEELLHPEYFLDIEKFSNDAEKNNGFDFTAGIEIEKYMSVSSAYYNSTVGGSTYETTVRTKIGEETAKFTIEIVKNDKGYGIYNIKLSD